MAGYAISYAFIGGAVLVAAIAFLWGGQAKITVAALLLASILLSNIIFMIHIDGLLATRQWTALFAAMDVVLFIAFADLYRRSNGLERTRWAGALAIFAVGMLAMDFLATALPQFAHGGRYALTLNILTIAALASCLIFTIPRSWDQAYGVLRIKMLYLWSDLFPRTMSVQVSDESGESEEVNSELSGQEPSAVNRHIGSKIREARIRAGTTLEKLSAAIGVSPAQVQKYESGKNRVSAEALFNFAKFFGLEVKFFYEGLEAPSRMRLVGDSNGDSRR